MNWSPQQSRALDSVGRWLASRDRQVFRLFGYAGTGKTTLARHLAEGVDRVVFAAYTGKAALVMARAGCAGAQTIHSLIYRPIEKGKGELRRLEKQRAKADDPAEVEELDRLVREARDDLRRPAFSLDEESGLRDAELLVLDECSMVSEHVGRDLLSFGIPVLVLGDPAQLPPVFGGGFFTAGEPDVMLTEIHRQAKDDPIIRLATDVRSGEGLTIGEWGESRVVPTCAFNRDAVDPARRQVIVGRNATRRRANLRLRAKHLGGEPDVEVVKRDRLVCLRNDKQVGVLNGQIFRVEEVLDLGHDLVKMAVVDEDRPGEPLEVEAHLAPLRGEELDPWAWREALQFDYGYALTAHKAQGSQWDDVVVVDESRVFRRNARRWLYTAITRAAKRVEVVV